MLRGTFCQPVSWQRTQITGRATRIKQFNVGAPLRDYAVEHAVKCRGFRCTELLVHRELAAGGVERKGEWFLCSPSEDLEAIKATAGRWPAAIPCGQPPEAVDSVFEG